MKKVREFELSRGNLKFRKHWFFLVVDGGENIGYKRNKWKNDKAAMAG